jgi:transposase
VAVRANWAPAFELHPKSWTPTLGVFLKHTIQFKQAVVEDYLAGTEGFRLVARRYGIEGTMLRRWALWYETHGVAGLETKTGQYKAEFKLQVLQHMWENSLSLTQVAAVFNVRNTQSIASWERRYNNGGVQALEHSRKLSCPVMPAPTVKPDPSPDGAHRSREDLLKEVERLKMEIAYLKKVDALLKARQNSTTQEKRK